MTTQYKSKALQATTLAILFVVLMLHSMVSQAQSLNKNRSTQYKGFDVSFGVRSFSLTSDIAEINNLTVMQEGGKAGLVWGNSIVKTRIGAGFFYSAASVKRTVDLFESDASVNVYPLSALIKNNDLRIEPYFGAGIVYNKLKFSGHYLSQDAGLINYSTTEPYLGSIHQVNASTTAGLEYKLVNRRDFIHLYGEVQYGFALSNKTSVDAFKATSSGDQLMISMGVRFGAFR